MRRSSNHATTTSLYFEMPFSVRIDEQQRLWVLDAGSNGMRQARLLAFDLRTRSVVHRWDIPPGIAGLVSTLQDFHVGRDGRYIYIAESVHFAFGRR